MNKLTGVLVPQGKKARTKEVNNSLKELQEIVGGYIEVVTFNDYVVICDEYGRLKNKGNNRKVEGIRFVGDILILGSDGSGEFASLTDKQTEDILNKFNKIPNITKIFTKTKIEISKMVAEEYGLDDKSAANMVYEVLKKRKIFDTLKEREIFNLEEIKQSTADKVLDVLFNIYMDTDLSVLDVCKEVKMVLEYNFFENLDFNKYQEVKENLKKLLSKSKHEDDK